MKYRSAIRNQNRHPSAFTLIELMISIALSLLLILGVNQVFTYTTQAVGAGEAINADIRTSRAVQATFAGDFGGIVGNGSGPNDSACMIISSRAQYAYRSAKDLASEGAISGSAPSTSSTSYPTNNAAFLDISGDGQFGDPSVPGEVVYPATYNARNHRLDCLSFFSRDLFHRQTGNPGIYVANQASTEAWVWYGHLWLPDNALAFSANTFPLTPGISLSSNPNNSFASQLVLGRVATILSEKDASSNIYDSGGIKQWFVDRLGGPTAADLSPLSGGSALNVSAVSTTPSDPGSTNPEAQLLVGSRVDLASTSITNYRQRLAGYQAANPYDPANSSSLWWHYLQDGFFRFQCNPFVAKPMQAVDMAHASPYFVGGCSQFIVEYAGDFLTQDNDPTHLGRSTAAPAHSQYGDVNGPGSDGQIDFVIVNGQKQIAWYGMPRSTSGNVTIARTNGDVVPLRDYFQNMCLANGTVVASPPYTTLPLTSAAATALAAAGYPTFEKVAPAYKSATTPAGDYSNSNMSVADAQTGYTCAFGPNDARPKLIRITMTLEDPTGRLPDGLTYQYVFPVP